MEKFLQFQNSKCWKKILKMLGVFIFFLENTRDTFSTQILAKKILNIIKIYNFIQNIVKCYIYYSGIFSK